MMPHPLSRPTRSCRHHAVCQAEAGKVWRSQRVQDTLQNVEQTCVDVRERQQAAFLLSPTCFTCSFWLRQHAVGREVVEDQVVKKYDSLWQAVLAMYLTQE